MSTPAAERMRQMRARRAAGIEPAERPVRDADDLLAPAVAEAVAALGLRPEDTAAAALARLYAERIDGAESEAAALKVFGPLLLRTLEALGATPGSRKATGRPRPSSSKLAELRKVSRAPGRMAALRGAELP
jgi:hypothetical protein